MSVFEQALVITGPTASGKTAAALDLAERIGGEVVAMDSMTVYRGMDIGTAKPTAAERARVPHHLIDELDPWDGATVAWWLARAEAACAAVLQRGRVPLIVGGTPFYLKALLHGLFPGPPGDPELRRRLESEAKQEGNAALHARLSEIDPRTAARLHPNDIRRVVRALEVHAVTGRPISAWQTTWDTPAFAGPNAPGPPPARIRAVLLELPRQILYDRINQRVGAMLAAGWRDEVRRLRGLPRPPGKEASQAVGYRELLDELDGRGPGPEAVADLIRTRTRQFAKRQLTWFRHLPTLVPVSAGGPDPAGVILELWESGRIPPGPA